MAVKKTAASKKTSAKKSSVGVTKKTSVKSTAKKTADTKSVDFFKNHSQKGDRQHPKGHRIQYANGVLLFP